MRDPVLSLCGHLFEKTVVESTPQCPIDTTPISAKNCIPLKELQSAITAWRLSHTEDSKRGGNPAIPTAAGKKPVKVHLAQFPSSPQGVPRNNIENLSGALSTMHIGENGAEEKKPPARSLDVIRNAHQDDIHGFVSIAPDVFVSGSKDNSLKMWNINGAPIRQLATATGGYKYWVTALTKFSDGYWASGTRNGYITVWRQDGREIFSTRVASQEVVCKERNKSRVNCITELENTETVKTFYVGTPKHIRLLDGQSQQVIKEYHASSNDWVYCIEVLETRNLLVVIGSDLEYWDMQSTAPKKQKLIQETAAQHRSQQRPHISAITRLDHNRALLASALFDGTVKITDIVARTLTRNYHEHVGRVWSVMNLSPHILASSADDKTIKIWDVRQSKSTRTIGGNPGRVSSLLRLSDTILISGSCPDNLSKDSEKASITFWDIRKIV
jgi:hypothetical protein